MKKLLATLLVAGAPAFALAQVDYNEVSYEVVLDQTTVDGLGLTGMVRYGVAVDGASDMLYVIAQQSGTPFEDALISVDLAASNAATLLAANLDADPVVSSLGQAMNITSRPFVFTGGRLLAVNRGGGSNNSQLVEFNTTTGAMTELLPDAADPSPIVAIAGLSSTELALQQGTFSGGDGSTKIFTVGGSIGTNLLTTPLTGPQGMGADSAGDLYVVDNITDDAAVARIANPLTTPSQSDVTPGAFTGVNFNTIRGFGIANDDWYIYKRGGTIPELHIWDGTAVTTIDRDDLLAGLTAAGFPSSTFDSQDTHGFAVRAVSATETQVFFGARDVTGGWAVLAVTFGGNTVQDWMVY